MKKLVRRAYGLCSNDYYLGCKLQNQLKVFHELYDCPIWVINKFLKEFQSKQNETTPIATTNGEKNKNLKKPLVNIGFCVPRSLGLRPPSRQPSALKMLQEQIYE